MTYATPIDYSKYNQCDHLINHFSALDVLESALLWCGFVVDDIPEQKRLCEPKGTTSTLLQNIFIHPFVNCVEVRCRLLHLAFDDGLLKMGRDGKNGDYIDKMGHIAHARRTITISDLKDYIKTYHPNDMPKTLFNDIEKAQAQPISHDDYLAIKGKCDSLQATIDELNARLDKARHVYKEQTATIKKLQGQTNELHPRTANNAAKVIACLAELASIDYTKPNGQASNGRILEIADRLGIELSQKAIADWLKQAHEQAR